MDQKAVSAWAAARDRVLLDPTLSKEEKAWLESMSVEKVINEIKELDSQYAQASNSRKIMKAINPLLEGLQRFAPAMDVFSNADPNGVLSLVWGSLRMILVVGIIQYNAVLEASSHAGWHKKYVCKSCFGRLRLYLQLKVEECCNP